MFINFFTLTLFFLISKEVLFYGEERLIVLSYLTLFILLFFALGSGLSLSFKERADALKVEFDIYFASIISILRATKKLILNFGFFNLKLVRLCVSVFKELVYYYAIIANFSSFKLNFFKLKITNLLHSSSTFFLDINTIINKQVFPRFITRVAS